MYTKWRVKKDRKLEWQGTKKRNLYEWKEKDGGSVTKKREQLKSKIMNETKPHVIPPSGVTSPAVWGQKGPYHRMDYENIYISHKN